MKFVVPNKLTNSVKISLKQEIPELCPPSEQMKQSMSEFELERFRKRRKHIWGQLRWKVQNKIDTYYEEMQ